jgi:hypothetical protein
MNRRSEFFDILLRGSGPSAELLGAFALGLLVVGILSNLAYDLVLDPLTILPQLWQPLIASLILTGLAYLLYQLDRRRWRKVEVSVDESRLAPPHAGLIWLLGPQIEHLMVALAYHRQSGGGLHCWLVMQSRQEAVQQAFDQLSNQILEHGWETRLHPVYIDQLDAQSAYEAVVTVFDREAGEEGLTPAQVIADITGGTKPLTAGMLLAALAVDGDLEYVESDRDDKGLVIQGTQRVVLVDTKFHFSQEEPA